jgi:hypothetical protein
MITWLPTAENARPQVDGVGASDPLSASTVRDMQPVARLTTPAQMVASVPLWLGFVPTESLVVMCCHEPRGRVGLTLRIDLPDVAHERELVEEVLARIAHERATRVVLAIYTDEPDGAVRARTAMARALQRGLAHLIVTELVLVRQGRFWSYLCDDPTCCPPEGTPVDAAVVESPLLLIKAERALEGSLLLPDREALAKTLAGPQLLAADAARQRCLAALDRPEPLITWDEALTRPVTDDEAADLAVSLDDRVLRDALGMRDDAEALLPLLEDLCRRTPAPFDAPVCTLYAWIAYQAGGGARVSIALERALTTDPDYRLARLLLEAVNAQVAPRRLRAGSAATRRGRRSRR